MPIHVITCFSFLFLSWAILGPGIQAGGCLDSNSVGSMFGFLRVALVDFVWLGNCSPESTAILVELLHPGVTHSQPIHCQSLWLGKTGVARILKLLMERGRSQVSPSGLSESVPLLSGGQLWTVCIFPWFRRGMGEQDNAMPAKRKNYKRSLHLLPVTLMIMEGKPWT